MMDSRLDASPTHPPRRIKAAGFSLVRKKM